MKTPKETKVESAADEPSVVKAAAKHKKRLRSFVVRRQIKSLYKKVIVPRSVPLVAEKIVDAMIQTIMNDAGVFQRHSGRTFVGDSDVLSALHIKFPEIAETVEMQFKNAQKKKVAAQ